MLFMVGKRAVSALFMVSQHNRLPEMEKQCKTKAAKRYFICALVPFGSLGRFSCLYLLDSILLQSRNNIERATFTFKSLNEEL